MEGFINHDIMTASKGEHEQLEYHLTPKGLEFKAVIIALTQWGDKWSSPHGPPIHYEHDGCGGKVEQQLRYKSCERIAQFGNLS